ncbi:unnamed protein product, partial [Symbiodinium microadriaticum]
MPGNPDDGVLDTESADDTRVYRIKLSKWFQGTFNAIQHPLFWFLLYVCRCMRGPLRHFFAFVQLQSKNCNAAQVVQQLVTGKLDEFLNEYRILYDRMNDIVLKAMELSGCDSLFKDDMEGQAALYPYKLLWFVKENPLRHCTHRQGVAAELLALKTVDAATESVRALCKEELRYLANNGTFPKPRDSSGSLLWAVASSMSQFFYGETQSIEGLNSIVKLLGRRAPNISLELLSSRLTIKRLLGQADGATGCRKGFKMIKNFAEAEVAQLAEYSTPALSVLADSQRWAAAGSVSFDLPHLPPLGQHPVAEPAPARQHALQESQFLSLSDMLAKGFLPATGSVSPQAVQWAKSYNLGWKWCTGGGRRSNTSKKVKQSHNLDGFGLLVLKTPDLQDTSYYLVVDRFSHSVCFSRLTVFTKHSADKDPLECVRWVHDGSKFADSIESSLLFLRYFETCSQGNRVTVRSSFLSRAQSHELLATPGYLTVEQVMQHAVVLFDMTDKHMKGSSNPKTKKSRPKPQPEHHQREHDTSDVGDVDLDAALEGGEEPAAPDPSEEVFLEADLLDTSGSDDDADGCGDNTEIDASDFTTRELRKLSTSSNANVSAEDVSRAAGELASGAGSVSPTPELEEEALLLLLRQRSEDKARRLEGVGDVQEVVDDRQTPDDDNPDPNCNLIHECDEFETFSLWANNCLRVMSSLKKVHQQQHNRELGENRSISLVLMHSSRVAGCRCVRCKSMAPDGDDPGAVDPPELLWVTWLNNSASHGLTGRKARQIKLDSENKVIYSTAGSAFMGYPELDCDHRHADVIIKYVGAAMKKVKRTSPDRDEVPGEFENVRAFYEILLDRLHGVCLDHYGNLG